MPDDANALPRPVTMAGPGANFDLWVWEKGKGIEL
jgi:hypothetical protein